MSDDYGKTAGFKASGDPGLLMRDMNLAKDMTIKAMVQAGVISPEDGKEFAQHPCYCIQNEGLVGTSCRQGIWQGKKGLYRIPDS
jgi:hypothetical protein